MVPEDSFQLDFKVSSKGFSWVDLMYKKLEAICDEVDKNPSALIQETTKYIEHRMNTVGANVQKFCADLVDDILPPIPEVADKCFSSSLTVNSGDLYLTEKSDLEEKTTLNCESLTSPLIHQEAATEIDVSDEIKQLSASCIQKENISAKSAENLVERKTTECNFGAGRLEEVFEDNWNLQERERFCEHAEPLLNQINLLHQSNIEHLANRNDGTGVEGLAEQGKIRSMDVTGIVNSELPSPGDKPLVEDGISYVYLKGSENVKQNHQDEDRERVLSVLKPFIPNSRTCSNCVIQEKHRDESLDLAINEKEQSAYWYGNRHVEVMAGTDMSTSNSFLDLMDIYRCPDVENSDSEWEILEDIPA